MPVSEEYLPDSYTVHSGDTKRYTTNVKQAMAVGQTTAAISIALAEITGQDVESLASIEQCIDSESLNGLFSTNNSRVRKDVSVSFSCRGYRISLDSSGELRFTEQ